MADTVPANKAGPPPSSAPPPPPASKPAASATPPAAPATDDPAPSTSEGDDIDMETFQQILDLDEGDDHEFSRDMVWDFFSQVETTFGEMDAAFENKDLAKLASLGHFLKGSSAQLGIEKVQHACENIQHYGQKRDEEADVDITADEALARIDKLLKQVKIDYVLAKAWLRVWYTKNGGLPPDDDEA